MVMTSLHWAHWNVQSSGSPPSLGTILAIFIGAPHEGQGIAFGSSFAIAPRCGNRGARDMTRINREICQGALLARRRCRRMSRAARERRPPAAPPAPPRPAGEQWEIGAG
jgi:hypothetical protein